MQFLRVALACFCFVGLFFESASAQMRGRVQIVNNNVVADNGEPLRGAPFFLAIFGIDDIEPNEAQYRAYFKEVVEDYHMNCVRICPWIGNWAFMNTEDPFYDHHRSQILEMIDKCVQWAEEEGIYAVVNLHTRFNTPLELQRAKDFWNVVAPRYKDKTHVIFEEAEKVSKRQKRCQVPIWQLRQAKPDRLSSNNGT